MKVDKADLKLNYVPKDKEWRMAKDMDNAQGSDNYPKLKVDYGNTGEFTFKIQNPKNVTFAESDPFVVKPGKGSPNDFASQFSVAANNGDTLVVKVANANPNGGEYPGGDYHYQLNFNAGIPPLDPILTNGGCCKPAPQSNLLYYALGGVALLALFFLIIRPMLARRSAAATQDRNQH